PPPRRPPRALPGRVPGGLMPLLPDAAPVRAVMGGDDAFDPRRHARSRVYEYRILASPAQSPFWRRWSWHVPRPLDVAAMAAAAGALVGEHDCAAFRRADAKETPRSTVRRILESAMRAEPPLLVYRVAATAFLKHMGRSVVGTLVEVGLGDRARGCMAELLAGRDRTRAGATAPARGLTLVEVRY